MKKKKKGTLCRHLEYKDQVVYKRQIYTVVQSEAHRCRAEGPIKRNRGGNYTRVLVQFKDVYTKRCVRVHMHVREEKREKRSERQIVQFK